MNSKEGQETLRRLLGTNYPPPPVVPVIVVFTKYDELVTKKRQQIAGTARRLTEEVKRAIKGEAEKAFQSLCIDTLKDVANRRNTPDVPHAKVSSTSSRVRKASEDLLTWLQLVYDKADLVTLVEVTSRCVHDRIQLAWNTAQRVNLEENIETTIVYASLISEETIRLTDKNFNVTALAERVSKTLPQILFSE